MSEYLRCGGIRWLSFIGLLILNLNAGAFTTLSASWSNDTAHYNLVSTSNEFDVAFIEAIDKWNGQSNFSFSHNASGYADPCGSNPDQINSYRFSTNNCGGGWNSSTLAVTTSWFSGGDLIDTDIVFNNGGFSWSVYDGSLGSSIDFRRVAVHELGHALGLGHSDSNAAIMQPTITNTIIDPQTDDIDGMRAIYGGTGSTQQSLTVSVSGQGSVTSSDTEISCPSDCTQNYNLGSSVSLTAIPATGWQLQTWSGACSGTGACTVLMSSNQSVSAIFVEIPPVQHTLSASINGEGSLTSTPVGISCPSDCSQNYNQGQSVTINANPANGWRLQSWSGACTGAGTCTISMSSNRDISATFEIIPSVQHTLTVSLNGAGSVTSTPSGINCPSDCSQVYDEGASVNLNAAPDVGWQFQSWSGACTGSGVCTVSMSSNQSVNANFEEIPPVQHTLTVSVIGEGSVISSPAGINCPTDCTQPYDQGTTVNLVPIADTGWTFDGWEDSCTGSDLCEVSMSIDMNVSARFIESTVKDPVKPGAMSSIVLFLLSN